MRLRRHETSELLLRLGLAFSFLYPAISAIKDPYSWIGYFPAVMTDFVAPHQLILLHSFGLLEVALALWVLLGRNVRIPALIMAAMLLSIVALNTGQLAVLFRDLTIAFAALALASYRTRRVEAL